MDQNQYIDDTLIKLRRKYEKDEYVAVLLRQISDKDVELGKANAYIAGLEDGDWKDRHDKLKKTLDKINSRPPDANILKKNKEIKELKSKLELLRKSHSELITKHLKIA